MRKKERSGQLDLGEGRGGGLNLRRRGSSPEIDRLTDGQQNIEVTMVSVVSCELPLLPTRWQNRRACLLLRFDFSCRPLTPRGPRRLLGAERRAPTRDFNFYSRPPGRTSARIPRHLILAQLVR